MSPRALYFPLLDALRGIAALVVLFRHTGYFWDGLRLPHSYLAVDLFFLLSGVVVANAYETRLRQGLPARRFALIRLIRIYPLYALGSLLGLIPVLAALAGGSASPLQSSLPLALATAALLLPDLSDDALYPLNAPAWSLLFELAANLLYACLLRFMSRTVLWCIVLGCAAGLALLLAGDPSAGLHGGYSPGTMLTGLLRVGFGFFAGVLLWRGHAARPRALPAPVGWLALALAAAVLLARTPPGWLAWFDWVAVVLVFPVLIYCGMAIAPAATRLCAWLGALSYPLYVLHVPLARLVHGALEKGLHIAVDDWYPYLGVGFVLVLLPLCVWLDRRLDAPLRAMLVKRESGPAEKKAAGTVERQPLS